MRKFYREGAGVATRFCRGGRGRTLPASGGPYSRGLWRTGDAMDLFDLSGKTAVVTGGTRGIGLMIARGLLQAGARVYISSRKPDACTEAECLRLAGLVGEREQALNVLVNNAGATWGAPLAEFPAAAWDKVVDLNLKTP